MILLTRADWGALLRISNDNYFQHEKTVDIIDFSLFFSLFFVFSFILRFFVGFSWIKYSFFFFFF
jgi:hypothetical protein